MSDSIYLDIENNVTIKQTNSLLTGVFSEETTGWKYDLGTLIDLSSKQHRYTTTAGGHSCGLKDGFAQTDWSSGVIDDLDYLGIHLHKEKNFLQWIPKYRTGGFSIFADERRLYSDYSVMQIVKNDEELSCCSLHILCQTNSLSCALYKRLATGLIVEEKTFKFVESFTAESAELKTEENGQFFIDNFNKRYHEYTIRNNKLYLNDKVEVQIGFGNELTDVTSTWEKHDVSAGGRIYLKYLNVTEVEVVVYDGTTLTFLPEVSSLDYLDANLTGFSIDKDMGIISFSGFETDPVVLARSVTQISTDIFCYKDINFLALPERGVVQIDDELIAYQGKGLCSLLNCIRGFGGTTAKAHVDGTLVEFKKRGLFLTGTYYIKYTAVPRVDYEITDYTIRLANKTNWLNVHPFNNIKHNKIIQIISQTTNISRIELTTDESLIGGNVFGPLYFGTDVGRLIATAYDNYGNPVEDCEITIEKIYGPGNLNNSGSSVIGISNSAGETYAFYNAPYSDVDVVLHPDDMWYEGPDTLIQVSALPTTIAPQDIFLCQILKQDPSLGTVGKMVKAVAGGSAIEPWGKGYLDCKCEYTEDFNQGFLQIVYDGVRYNFTITKAYAVEVVGSEKLTRFYLNEYVSFLDDSIFLESTIWLYQAEAITWDSSLLNGVRILVYEWTTKYQHPKTKLAGAYGPVKPDSIVDKVLRFKNRHLSLPAPTDSSVNLGGYVIISPAEARFRAYAQDPYSNNIIISNHLRYNILFLNSLIGVDYSGVLPVPYGWSLISESFNIGSGIGGSNFLTVNPNASGINQLTLKGII